ncbi:LysR family transcriptional regulator [Ornithinimicrobium sp. W1665]|uniref:LysR family transcriptional regulator n=1 Tax=Ornithinimicrobium sp. W1665 TaxID=3416666 RepID=UPI003CE85F44
MEVETRHLRCFLAVADTLHFGRAAEQLHLAQPAVSRSVRQLERELGVDLLRRTTRSVSLTPAGEVYAQRARAVTDRLVEAAVAARATADGRSGTLRLGVTGSATYGFLPALARAAATAMPDVSLQVRTEMLTPEQEQALLDDRLDVGVLRLPTASPELDHVVVARERLVAALPADHALAGPGESPVRLADLSDDAFITYADGTGSVVLRTVLDACQDAGFVPRRAHQVTETSTTVALVAAGLGVALVPESAAALSLDGVVFRTVDSARRLDLALAWPADRPRPVVTRLLEALHAQGLVHPDPSPRPDAVEEIA